MLKQWGYLFGNLISHEIINQSHKIQRDFEATKYTVKGTITQYKGLKKDTINHIRLLYKISKPWQKLLKPEDDITR